MNKKLQEKFNMRSDCFFGVLDLNSMFSRHHCAFFLIWPTLNSKNVQNFKKDCVSLNKILPYVEIILLSRSSNGRNPRLFFASVYKSTSTSTSTTTLSTYSFCYTTVASITANCRRKKSYLVEDTDKKIDFEIEPSNSK